MYKKSLIFIGIVSISYNIQAQFNTITQEKVIRVRVLEEKVENKDTGNIVIPKVTYQQQRDKWNERRFVSLPIDTIIITSKYGMRKHPVTNKMEFHNGIDLKAHNDYVYSIMPGRIIKTGKNKISGNYVKIQHGDYITSYCHLHSILVNLKQSITAGQPIGISGNTGRSTGEHLHFIVNHNGKEVDPEPILNHISKLLSMVKKELDEEIEQMKKKSEPN